MPSLTQAIKSEARRLEFDLAGVTSPDPPPHWSTYENWLTMGQHGQMAYLADGRARARRGDPRRLLPECQSILVLAVRTPDPGPASPAGEDSERPLDGLHPAGRLAAYAWGDDYHLVLPERLKALTAFIEAQAGGPVPHRWYTDTGPVLERDLAQRAGLGWIGKNTCLINPGAGSYFLLAEILLGVQLDVDPPFVEDRCGRCRRCLDACPTQCILPDRTIDARRCISYLTIELKDAIPPDLRPRMGRWVFGCDVCQQVCPWNRFAGVQSGRGLGPRPGVSRPDLVTELMLTPGAFNLKFKASPVQRARRRGYLRNVAVALGNSGSLAAIPSLERALQDAEPLVREHAAWALGQLKSGWPAPARDGG